MVVSQLVQAMIQYPSSVLVKRFLKTPSQLMCLSITSRQIWIQQYLMLARYLNVLLQNMVLFQLQYSITTCRKPHQALSINLASFFSIQRKGSHFCRKKIFHGTFGRAKVFHCSKCTFSRHIVAKSPFKRNFNTFLYSRSEQTDYICSASDEEVRSGVRSRATRCTLSESYTDIPCRLRDGYLM